MKIITRLLSKLDEKNNKRKFEFLIDLASIAMVAKATMPTEDES